ncbi:MAG: EFR1 family ferrodoxin [Lachnospiraceae bacterium]|nr:EFR1 family ferrodoxin [Lachnospiraceae bacterium]
MRKRIYYFTGTGNSLRTAIKIAERFGDTELVSMRTEPDEVSAEDCDVIGFVYPVYHWTVPEHVVKFVEGLKINPNAYIFAVANPSFICGFACEKMAELIRAKGAELSFADVVHCVANYVIVYPPFPSPKFMVPRMERKASKIAGDIANRLTKAYPKAGAITRRKMKKFMGPYLELQKYADYPFTVSDACIGCGLCAMVCQCKNIELRDGKPAFLHHCMNCMACVTSCPKRAIGYEITAGDRELLNASGRKTSIVKLMGLPKKRKLYRNPYVSVQDLTKDTIEIH